MGLSCRGCVSAIFSSKNTCSMSQQFGVKNVLIESDTLDQPPESPDYQVIVKKSKWIRAEKGGFLEFHISPGWRVKSVSFF